MAAARDANLTTTIRASDTWLSRHFVQISIDGFGTTGGYFKKLLHGRAVVLKVASSRASGGAVEFWHEQFRPWVHFVPVRRDLDDLLQMIEWALRHKKSAARIAAAARTLALAVTYETSIFAGRQALFGATDAAFSLTQGDALETSGLLSSVFSTGVVLQRDVPALVWGHATIPGANVSLSLDGRELGEVTSAQDTGYWRCDLPIMVGSIQGHKLHAEELSEAQTTAAIDVLLFGDVFLCVGQSNLLGPSDLTRKSVRILPIFQPYGDARFCEREGAFARAELPRASASRWSSRPTSPTCHAFATKVHEHTRMCPWG
jgi:hypothetical protein